MLVRNGSRLTVVVCKLQTESTIGVCKPQIKDLPNSYLAVADTEIGRGSRIPIWMFGLLD